MKKLIALFLLITVPCQAAYLGSWKIDDNLTVMQTFHRFSSGAAYAATGDVDLWIYEDDSATQIVDVTMAAFDTITGLYEQKVALTAAAGFEAGKHYNVLIQATVDSVAAITTHNFQILAGVDANTVAGAAPETSANFWATEGTTITAGAPPAAPDAIVMMQYMYEALVLLKQEVTSLEKRFLAANGTTVLWERDLSDNGTTYTETASGAPD